MGTMLDIGPDRRDLPEDPKLGKWCRLVLSSGNSMEATYAISTFLVASFKTGKRNR